MTSKLFLIGNFLGYYLAWFLLLTTGETTKAWIGFSVALIFLGVHFLFSAFKKADAYLLLTLTGIGWCVDSINISRGLFIFDHSHIAIIPMWLLFIWMIFSQLFNHSLAWLKGRYQLASLLGAIFAPLSYYSGTAFNVVTFPNMPLSLLTIGLSWSVLMPLFVYLSSVFQRHTQ
jgi:hypothetical protein